MARFIALLRGINVGGRRGVAMPRLREVLSEAGFGDVVTYVQSGNVVLSSSGTAASVASSVRDAIEREWDFDVPVVVRTRAQLQKVVDADPLRAVATDPKRYQVTFFGSRPTAAAFDALDTVGFGDSQFELVGAELFTWTPAGIQSDRMLRELAKAHRGIDGTARNWRTVKQLLELSGEQGVSPAVV